jgi:hypothetical protein
MLVWYPQGTSQVKLPRSKIRTHAVKLALCIIFSPFRQGTFLIKGYGRSCADRRTDGDTLWSTTRGQRGNHPAYVYVSRDGSESMVISDGGNFGPCEFCGYGGDISGHLACAPSVASWWRETNPPLHFQFCQATPRRVISDSSAKCAAKEIRDSHSHQLVFP